MSLIDWTLTKKSDIEMMKSEIQQLKSDFMPSGWSGANMQPLVYDGEKTPYELGTPINIRLDYQTLRMRSWESYLTSDIIQNAIKKYILWIVGAGLKLQAKPVEQVLKKYNVNVDESVLDEFMADAESQFRLYAELKESTYSMEHNLHDEAAEALKNALMAGDVLCLLRTTNKRVNIETIDGKNVRTPIMSDWQEKARARGNVIVDGVEINPKGQHVAYYVMQADLTYKRVMAYGSKSGKRQAWLMYGLKYKKSDVRGMALLTAVLETAASMDRYKDATLKAAEENAKIPLTIEHEAYSDGSNPFADQIKEAFGKGKGVATETSTADCDVPARKIAQTTNKQVYNLTQGARLKRHSGSTDANFAGYYGVNADIVYATIGMPPEVGLDKFGGAYSGSRAALKSWEYKMFVDRIVTLKRQFYGPFYVYWLDVQVLLNFIQAPGYIDALMKNNYMVLGAYRNNRFIGPTVPHIDPVKEVTAERLKLGDAFKYVPLSDAEQAMERLNTGDYEIVIKKAEKEYEKAKTFTSVNTGSNNNN